MSEFIISGKMMAEMLLRLGVYDEKILSEYIQITDKIRSAEVNSNVSEVAVIAKVREELVKQQREFD